MTVPPSDSLQGTLDLLILKAVALQQLDSMGIARRIAQINPDTLDTNCQ